MRHILLSARREIESLRRRNEILEAKVDVMDLLGAILCAPTIWQHAGDPGHRVGNPARHRQDR